MKTPLLAAALFGLASPQAAPPPVQVRPAPSEIAAAAPAAHWIAIDAADLMVMELAPAAAGGAPRRVVIQLMPAPFSQGWIGNIRRLVAARWWDGTSVNRVQDNYVTQWGDATEKKPLPAGIARVPEAAYVTGTTALMRARPSIRADRLAERERIGRLAFDGTQTPAAAEGWHQRDAFAPFVELHRGWPIAVAGENAWPVHCYGMVGVGRNLSPDTGTGAALYTVIGHAPRHLDRNIALIGRVIEGMEHLSSLPRGTEALGFYATAAERVPILSVRLASDMPAAVRPRFEYLSTDSESFARYAQARANRRDPFFNVPAGGVDICNLPVPIRATK